MVNLKVRMKNKAFLITMAAAIVAFIYQILSICGITPAISEDEVTQIVGLIINVLVAVGIVADPTTPGVADNAYEGHADDDTNIVGYHEPTEAEIEGATVEDTEAETDEEDDEEEETDED